VYFLVIVPSLVVNTSIIDFLERLVSEMTCNLLIEILNSTYLLIV